MTDTKITYNVDDAISALNKLNKKVGEAADHVVNELGNKASAGLDKFIDGLGDVSPVAGNVVGKIRDVVSVMGPMGLVAGTAAAGLAAVVSNLVDLPGLLADSAGGMEAFGSAVDRQFRIFEKFDDINDAIAKSANKRALRELNLKQAEIGQEQVRLNNLKAGTQAELKIAEEVVREKERILEQSVKKRIDLEKQFQKAAGEQRVRQVEGGALKKERAVGDLAAAAQQEALKGNVDLAKDLRDRAQEIADELGGHVFYQKQVEAATSAINGKLQDQVKDEAKIQSGLQSELDAAKQIVAQRQRELDIIKERERLLRNDTKDIRAQRRLIQEKETERSQTDLADQGAGQVIAAVAKIRQEFEIGGRSAAENIKDSLRLTLGGLSSKARVDAGIGTERDALKLVEQVSKTLLKPGGVSAQEVADLQPLVEKLGALTGALEVAKGQGTLNTGQVRGLEQLQRFIADFQQAAEGAAKFAGADRDPNQVIQRDSEPGAAVQQFNQRINDAGAGVSTLNDAATRAADSLNKIGTPSAVAPIGSPVAQIPQAPAAAQPGVVPQTTQQNITVNANVRGGIIDREVTEKITDIIRRELRKQTGPSVSSKPAT